MGSARVSESGRHARMVDIGMRRRRALPAEKQICLHRPHARDVEIQGSSSPCASSS